MIEQEVEIPTPEGVSGGVLYLPEGGGPWPGTLFLTDIGGIRRPNRDMARRVAEQGFVVLMPNVFYRTGKPPLFAFPFVPGEARSRERLAALSSPLTAQAMERDAIAYVDFLSGLGSVRSGGMAVVGYCFTGAMALRTAAARPDHIATAVSFHGGRLVTDAATSPHLVLPRIKARLYFGHASNDGSMPAEAIARLDTALTTWGGVYQSEVYEGARHGWTVPDSPAYNQAQAERAFGKLAALLRETLQPAGR